MGTTPNYSWPYPESSDYVADGATAIENLADAIDTTVANLGKVTDYEPTLNFGGEGNGSVIARYARVDDLVHWELQFILGSTSAINNGFRPSLPFTARTVTYGYARYGYVFCRRSDSGEIYHGSYYYSESGANARPQIYNDNSSGLQRGSTTISATSPFSWSSGDTIYMTGTYLAL